MHPHLQVLKKTPILPDTLDNTAILKDLTVCTPRVKKRLKGDDIILESITEKTMIKINGEIVLKSMASPVIKYLLKSQRRKKQNHVKATKT